MVPTVASVLMLHSVHTQTLLVARAFVNVDWTTVTSMEAANKVSQLSLSGSLSLSFSLSLSLLQMNGHLDKHSH